MLCVLVHEYKVRLPGLHVTLEEVSPPWHVERITVAMIFRSHYADCVPHLADGH
jgi:hypothetical protein